MGHACVPGIGAGQPVCPSLGVNLITYNNLYHESMRLSNKCSNADRSALTAVARVGVDDHTIHLFPSCV